MHYDVTFVDQCMVTTTTRNCSSKSTSTTQPSLNGQYQHTSFPLSLSFTRPLTYSPTHSLTLSLTQSLTHPLTHSLTQSLTHPLTHPLTYPLTHSLNHSLTYPLTHSLSPSLPPSFRLSDLLAAGAVMGTVLQPHESHIPFVLQVSE